MNASDKSFKDHFSAHAGDYAAFRPTYPGALFDWLASQAPTTTLAWDCATGNGQAALALAERFERVYASDASARQIKYATAHPRVEYRVEAAEHSSLEAGSVDLLTVAQAYHWFDHEKFHHEAGRALKAGGLLAVWAYPLMQIDDDIDELVFELYERELGEFWPAERTYIDRGYRDFAMPWPEIIAPSLEMRAQWDLGAMLAYLQTWSALQRCLASGRENPVEKMRDAFAAAWGDPAKPKKIRWPLILRVCRKPPPTGT